WLNSLASDAISVEINWTQTALSDVYGIVSAPCHLIDETLKEAKYCNNGRFVNIICYCRNLIKVTYKIGLLEESFVSQLGRKNFKHT
ncbi:unnamed protein product, partial [Ceratitis capitata]